MLVFGFCNTRVPFLIIMLKGISTQLFLDERLTIGRLQSIQNGGFDCVEILAMPPHFDYRNKQTVERLGAWLRDQDSFLASIHTPFLGDYQGLKNRQWLSLCDLEPLRRQTALDETRRSLELTEKVMCPKAVVHPGAPGDLYRLKLLDALYKSLDVLVPFAEARGVRIVLENIPNSLSRLDFLKRFLEEAALNSVGICFDVGHANLQANPSDEIGAGGPWIHALHLHDNLGVQDEHLFPFEGNVRWEEVLSALEKIQYRGSYLLEAKAGDRDPLERIGVARQVFDRFELIIERNSREPERTLAPPS